MFTFPGTESKLVYIEDLFYLGKMKSVVKCYRCGKEYDLNSKNIKEIISCSHCHQQMRFTEKTRKHFRLVRYFFVLFICLFLAFGMSLVTQNNYIVLLVMMGVAMIIALYSDKWCMVLTDRIFGLNYEEYHPEKISKKQQRKESQSQK